MFLKIFYLSIQAISQRKRGRLTWANFSFVDEMVSELHAKSDEEPDLAAFRLLCDGESTWVKWNLFLYINVDLDVNRYVEFQHQLG